MIYLVPTPLLTHDALLSVKRRAADVLQSVSQRQNGGADVIVRDLTATDLFVGTTPNPATNVALMSNGVALAQNVYSGSMYPNAKLASGQVVVIWGFTARQTVPHIQELQFRVGQLPVAQVRLTQTYAFSQSPDAVFSEPVYWTQNQAIDIRALADQNVLVNAEVFELKGWLCEKASDTVGFQPVIDSAQAAPHQPVAADIFAVAS